MKPSRGYSEAQEQHRDQMIQKHYVLVKKIAHHLIARLPHSVLVDDLYQAGVMGLMEAIQKFDPNKGASFETYAGIRIKGSMLDEVRKGDWAPRSVHRNSRRISEAIRILENQPGSEATPKEISGLLQITIEQYNKMLNDISYVKVFAIEDLGITEDVIDDPNDTINSQPIDFVIKTENKEKLKKAIESLPEKEALVLALYYEEDLNLREIGEVLGVTESRISQIHAQSLLRLKTRLKELKR